MTSAEGTTATKRRIVVGVDGSQSSLAALRWAVRQAKLTGAPLEIVSTWEWPVSHAGWRLPSRPTTTRRTRRDGNSRRPSAPY